MKHFSAGGDVENRNQSSKLVALTMGAMRLHAPIKLPTTPIFIVAAVGLVTEIWLMTLMYRQQKHDINVRGAFWHVAQTFLGSFGIIAAALVISRASC